MTERQELHCHECDKYVQFNVDISLNGNHVLHCPNCGHEHCRVVLNGRITSDRWDRRNGIQTYYVAAATTNSSTVSTWDGYSTVNPNTTVATGFVYRAWMNTTIGT